MSRVTLLVLLAACTEYEFAPKADDALPGDTGAPDEECDGEDNDGDGETDEGYGDIDGDGVADCVDDTCETAGAAAGSADVDPDCVAPDVVVEDPWSVQIEWQWSSLSSAPQVGNAIMMPVIGNLTDDDGDGLVTEDDVPDIALVAFPGSSISNGTLVVLDGATGSEHFSQAGWDGGGGIAMADVDGDGSADIVGFDTSRRLKAVRADGTLLWVSTSAVTTIYPQATVADLDGDGVPEVLAENLVIDGATGAVEQSLPQSSGIPYTMTTTGDIDLDGIQEIIYGNTVYEPGSGAQWSASFAGSYGHWSAILNADSDPEAEVAMIGGGTLALFEHDGTLITQVSAGTGQPGPPCVADFDGDGDAEIAWASSSQLNMYELDGTRRWSTAVNDSSGLAACSGYDADGDGIYEVLFADQDSFDIFNGASGETLYTQSGHASGTLWEYPAVADVDNDGSAEVVITSNNYGASGWSGVTVFGHSGDGWQKSGTTWHVHDFAVTNINPDGTVPADPSPPWQVYNVYRARPAVDTAALDLQVEIIDACWASCETGGAVDIVVQVKNTGGADATASVPVSLYASDGSLLDTQSTPGGLSGGSTAAGLTFTVRTGQVSDGFYVVVDDDGTGDVVTECDEENNTDTWTEIPCP